MKAAPIMRNWRDPNPYIGHETAIVWAILNRYQEDGETHACLRHMSGVARHAMQGGKASDFHQHEGAEQYYYILSGGGQVRIGEERYPVQAGSVAYFPPRTPHQFFAGAEHEWAEYLIITCPVERQGSKPRVCNWREAVPRAGAHGAAVTWHLLESVDEKESETGQPCLLGFYYLARQALVRGKASDNHKHDDKEQVYYVLEGRGTMLIDNQVRHVAEGDVVYLPPGVWHQIANENWDGWLSYLVMS